MDTETGGQAMRPALSADASRRMVNAAVSEATSMSVPVTVVAVDESGVLKELRRADFIVDGGLITTL